KLALPMSLLQGLRPLTSVPAAEDLHPVWFKADSVKHFKVSPHNEAPDLWPLTDCGVALRKETQGLASFNNDLSQFLRGGGIMNGDGSDDPFKIFQEAVFKNYLELHALTRARTSLPESP